MISNQQGFHWLRKDLILSPSPKPKTLLINKDLNLKPGINKALRNGSPQIVVAYLRSPEGN